MIDYIEFFGLKEDPFKITPDPAFFFPSISHRNAERLLNYVVDSGEGFCVIVGEPGTGKTTVIRKFLNSLEGKAEYSLILSPQLNPVEFLRAVLQDLGIEVKEENKEQLLKTFKNLLEEKVKNGKKIFIIVDEAQLLPIETLEELRLLSNLETDKEKLVQIILVGQPELDEKLKLPQLRQLLQRITSKTYLTPLNFDDTKKYINHRLMLAGGGNITFTEKAFKKIYRYSKGIPRLINIISSRALMSAFIENSTTVKPDNVEVAVETIDPEIINVKGDKKTIMKLLLIFLISLNISLALFIIYKLINH
jgi:general secretion pathway protein A